jgi:PAS domain-containing protein
LSCDDLECARLAAIVESVNASIISLDGDGLIETWNAGSEVTSTCNASQ